MLSFNFLKEKLTAEIFTDEKTLEKYSSDYSIFKIKPEIVIAPQNLKDIQNIINWVLENKKTNSSLSITPRSAGTDMSGGPLNTSIILDFTKHFNKILEINSNEKYAVIQPGVYFRDFEKEISKFNLLYPPYPASRDLCALGGMISNNSGGEKTLKYGKTEDYVLSLKAILADGNEYEFKPLTEKELKEKIAQNNFEGEIYKKIYNLINSNYDLILNSKPRVSKNSTGYNIWNVYDKNKKIFNLSQIFVGAQGTLGIVTEAKLKLIPKTKYSKLVVAFINNLNVMPQIVNEILKFNPESLESFDDKTLNVAFKFFFSLIKIVGTNIFSLAFSFLPELLMVLRGGMPKMILLIELTGDDLNEIENNALQIKNQLNVLKIKSRIINNENETKKYWAIRRYSFKLLHGAIKNKTAIPFIDDFVVLPKDLPEVLPKVNAILEKHKDKFIYTIAGHPGNGNFHIIPLADLRDEETRKLIPIIMEEVYKIIIQFNGSLSGEHNDGLIRTPYLKMMYNEKIIKIFEEIKTILDPENIFNPGKKVFYDEKFILNHIRKDNF
ncbi:MAG: FAD-binding oxidoreductase [Minisyncoccia bacterium]